MISPSLIILLALTVFAYLAAMVTWDGAIVGFLLGFAFAEMPSPAAFVAFLVFVLMGSYCTKWGASTKVALGVAQTNQGRRGFLHALANVGPAAIFGFLALRSCPDHALVIEIATCAGLAAVFSDTVASECGQWLGGQPRSILNWQPVPVGSDGGVTMMGMFCSLVAAILMGLAIMPWLGLTGLIAVALSGLLGNIADSLLGASIERHLGHYGGFIVNACASIVGLTSGYALASWMTVSS